jgi:predicted enzyme related to lactoylglutathione lyase
MTVPQHPALLLAVAVVALAVGTLVGRLAPAHVSGGAPAHPVTGTVTGIGGVFVKSRDPAALLEWYRAHLGIESAEWGGFAFQWQEKERPDETGYTVWGVFPESTDYFPSDQPYMVNFRVSDLAGLLAALEDAGVEVAGGIETHPNGSFAWILDPEGRKIELWEPVPSGEDPYLE